MPDRSSYDYAVVRLVPHVEREEFLNVGVILFCRTRRFLEARLRLDAGRLAGLCPDLSPETLQPHLDLIAATCAGGPAAGDIGRLTQAERFHWLVAPRSTVVQVSDVHCGLSDNPGATLEALFKQMVG